jgi:hypothetical protein
MAVVANGNASSAFGLARGFDSFDDTTNQWRGLPRAEQVFDLALTRLRQPCSIRTTADQWSINLVGKPTTTTPSRCAGR